MVPLEDGSGNARGHRRTFCTVCVESYAVGWVPEDDECPVCGAALEAEPAMAVPPAAPELSGDAPQSTTAGLLAEQQNFLMGQLGEGGAGTGAEGLRRAAEEIALAMSEQVGDTSSRAASPEAIASLQRIIIEVSNLSSSRPPLNNTKYSSVRSLPRMSVVRPSTKLCWRCSYLRRRRHSHGCSSKLK